MADWLSSKVIKKIQWNERLFSLRIHSGFKAFEAGQFVRVALDIAGERVARPYSLVNKPGDDYLEIYFNIVAEGPLTPKLAELEAGDEIFVTDRANGFLTADEVPECKHLWLLATGTGVGPFLSILKAEKVWQRFEKIVLGYSVRNFFKTDEFSLTVPFQMFSEMLDRHGESFLGAKSWETVQKKVIRSKKAWGETA